jgi:hypothetical protein
VVVQATRLAGLIHHNTAVFCGRAFGIDPVLRDVSRCRVCCCVVWVCGEGVVMMTDSHKAVVTQCMLRAKSVVMREHNSHATKTMLWPAITSRPRHHAAA